MTVVMEPCRVCMPGASRASCVACLGSGKAPRHVPEASGRAVGPVRSALLRTTALYVTGTWKPIIASPDGNGWFRPSTAVAIFEACFRVSPS